MNRKQAFTLIELLIVVAIIAILAAIAVPNFLEAQTRAKVSRVKADMRTIVTALESYRVDSTKYPSAVYLGFPDDGEWHMWFLYALTNKQYTGIGTSPDGRNPLTSPISYLATIPLDPFTTYYSVRYMDWGQVTSASVFYAYRSNGQFPFGIPDPPGPYIWWPAVDYYLRSAGPNCIFYSHDSGLIYDPTNGTVSDGDMWYVGPKGFLGTGRN
jgi:prepilin-type N-terminal cleavage/methylation domain-containing protein